VVHARRGVHPHQFIALLCRLRWFRCRGRTRRLRSGRCSWLRFVRSARLGSLGKERRGADTEHKHQERGENKQAAGRAVRVALRGFASHGNGRPRNAASPECGHDGEECRSSQYGRGPAALAKWTARMLRRKTTSQRRRRSEALRRIRPGRGERGRGRTRGLDVPGLGKDWWRGGGTRCDGPV